MHKIKEHKRSNGQIVRAHFRGDHTRGAPRSAPVEDQHANTDRAAPRGPTLFTVCQAAEYLGVSKGFMDKKRITGDGPIYIKLGAKIRYSPNDLDAWLAAQRRRITSQK